MRALARVVDGALAAIQEGRCPDRAAAQSLAARVRRLALALFPDKEEAFALIYQPRLERAIRQRFPLH
ncbi:MAG: hypothetical protein C4525_06855 [Desulfarculus sp.]|nr:MAG: hypothetical protein C4525_06855 [Desulfarculus sp.]